jgi:hypothetical protein
MTVEIKDKDKNIQRSLRVLGFNLSSQQMEVILNVSDFVKTKKGSTTLQDLTEIEVSVNSLFVE